MEIESQEKAILKHLQEGHRISQWLAANKFGCWRLGARIFDLRAKGHDIKTNMVTDTSGKRFASYSLIKQKKSLRN